MVLRVILRKPYFHHKYPLPLDFARIGTELAVILFEAAYTIGEEYRENIFFRDNQEYIQETDQIPEATICLASRLGTLKGELKKLNKKNSKQPAFDLFVGFEPTPNQNSNPFIPSINSLLGKDHCKISTLVKHNLFSMLTAGETAQRALNSLVTRIEKHPESTDSDLVQNLNLQKRQVGLRQFDR
jgi:hypothetical protein